ncbi:hypothetical protein ACFL0W_05190 [Nanoarchaeota archaeon]
MLKKQKKNKKPNPIKKAEVQGQMFVYILSVIIIALIMFFGYKSVASLKEDADVAELISIQKDLENTIKTMRSDYGAIKIKEITLPAGYKTLCIVDLNHSDSAVSGRPLVDDAWESKTASIFYISPAGDFKDQFVENIQVESPYFFCLESEIGLVKIRIEGTGNKAKVFPG